MPPKTPEPSSGDLFRMLLENIVDQNHELVRLSRLIDWVRYDEAFGAFYNDQKGRDGRAASVAAHERAIGRTGLCGMDGKSVFPILLRGDHLPAQIAF